MIKSDIFLGSLHLDNTPDERAVMIYRLLVFLTHPTGESIVQRVNVAVLIHFPPVCEKVRNFRFPENPRVEEERTVE